MIAGRAEQPAITRALRLRVGRATFLLGLMGAVPGMVVIWRLSTGYMPHTAPAMVRSISTYALLPAVIAGILGVTLAGELLHAQMRRAYVAGAFIPVLALATFLGILIFSSWAAIAWASGPASSAGNVPLPGLWLLYMGYGLLFVGWLIVPIGWLATWWLRRRYLAPATLDSTIE